MYVHGFWSGLTSVFSNVGRVITPVVKHIPTAVNLYTQYKTAEMQARQQEAMRNAPDMSYMGPPIQYGQPYPGMPYTVQQPTVVQPTSIMPTPQPQPESIIPQLNVGGTNIMPYVLLGGLAYLLMQRK